MNNTEKLAMCTPSNADKNFATLAELFPNAVTETIDENGAVVRAIDKDVLAQEINAYVVEGREERYQFTWPISVKAYCLPIHRLPPLCALAARKAWTLTRQRTFT